MTTGVGSLSWLPPELLLAHKNKCQYGYVLDLAHAHRVVIIVFAAALRHHRCVVIGVAGDGLFVFNYLSLARAGQQWTSLRLA